MINYRTILLFLCWPFIGFSQATLTLDDFLKGVNEDQSIQNQDRQLDFLRTTPNHLPVVKKLEVRTEFNEFNIRQQEYLVRASLNGRKSIKSQADYQQTILNKNEVERQLNRSYLLRERYDLYVSYVFLQEILDTKKEQEALLQERIVVLKRSVSLSSFDVLDLIEAEEKWQQKQQEVLDVENSILGVQQMIQAITSSSAVLQPSVEELISVQEIEVLIAQMKTENEVNHPELDLLAAKSISKEMAYELELAQSKFSLGYIQAKYSDDENDPFRQNLSIGIGMDIPLKSTNRLDLNKRQLDIVEAEGDYQYANQVLQIERNKSWLELQSSIRKYKLIQEQIDNNRAVSTLDTYGGMTEVLPGVLLSLQEGILNKQLTLKEVRLELMYNYITYLDWSGKLNQQPFINYLKS